MNRRELLKFFGVGTVIAPVASGDITARLIAEPNIVLASEFPNGHKPVHYLERLKWNPFEAIWLKFWQIENNPPSWLNGGVGPLEHCLKRYPTEEEKAAVAAVLAWFGSNCGHCFIQETLEACGYRVVHDEKLPGAKEVKAVQYGSVFPPNRDAEYSIQRRGRTIHLKSGVDPTL